MQLTAITYDFPGNWPFPREKWHLEKIIIRHNFHSELTKDRLSDLFFSEMVTTLLVITMFIIYNVQSKSWSSKYQKPLFPDHCLGNTLVQLCMTEVSPNSSIYDALRPCTGPCENEWMLTKLFVIVDSLGGLLWKSRYFAKTVGIETNEFSTWCLLKLSSYHHILMTPHLLRYFKISFNHKTSIIIVPTLWRWYQASLLCLIFFVCISLRSLAVK